MTAGTAPLAAGPGLGLPVARPDAGSYGLPPRPPVDPVVLAVVAAAADQLWPRPVVVVSEQRPARPAWRFSGRWWAKPTAVRRERPWA